MSILENLFKKKKIIEVKTESTIFSPVTNKEKFKSIRIGNQEWMAENLNVDKFRNGDLIPYIESNEEWEKAGSIGNPAWCYYDNNAENGKVFGKLYNWYAVNDRRGLAPKGWHVPTDSEWNILIDYLGGVYLAGGKLKETGTTHWETPNTGATNESGFKALPGGSRKTDLGYFDGISYMGIWWCSTKNEYRFMYYQDSFVDRVLWRTIKDGFSIRCVRD